MAKAKHRNKIYRYAKKIGVRLVHGYEAVKRKARKKKAKKKTTRRRKKRK